MKATNTVPSANEGAPEESCVCTPAEPVEAWERFRAGMAAIVRVPKDQVESEITSMKGKRAKLEKSVSK